MGIITHLHTGPLSINMMTVSPNLPSIFELSNALVLTWQSLSPPSCHVAKFFWIDVSVPNPWLEVLHRYCNHGRWNGRARSDIAFFTHTCFVPAHRIRRNKERHSRDSTLLCDELGIRSHVSLQPFLQTPLCRTASPARFF